MRRLAFWKEIAPDIPILTQAKAEYAKLHRFLAGRKCQFGTDGLIATQAFSRVPSEDGNASHA